MSINVIVSPEEIEATIFQFNLHKFPSSDGFPTIFFQKFWLLLSPHIIPYILSIFNSTHFPCEMNKVLNSIIPKRDAPE